MKAHNKKNWKEKKEKSTNNVLLWLETANNIDK